MFTKAQEEYLKKLADAGLAEQKEIDERNEIIIVETKVAEARKQKESELKEAADALIEDGLKDFEENIAPNIK